MDRYQVTIVKYGTRSTVRSEVYLNYHVYGEPDGPIGMDYFFWLVRNRERTIANLFVPHNTHIVPSWRLLTWCVSAVADFTTGTFQPVIGDTLDATGVRRVLFCAGKVYYDLIQAREDRGITDTAIVRVEQLYPLPIEEIRAVLRGYPNAVDYAWVQEEPANQGAWSFIALNLLEHLDGVSLRRISRPSAAAPAVGSTKLHDAEQHALIEAALPKK